MSNANTLFSFSFFWLLGFFSYLADRFVYLVNLWDTLRVALLGRTALNYHFPPTIRSRGSVFTNRSLQTITKVFT